MYIILYTNKLFILPIYIYTYSTSTIHTCMILRVNKGKYASHTWFVWCDTSLLGCKPATKFETLEPTSSQDGCDFYLQTKCPLHENIKATHGYSLKVTHKEVQ